MILREKNPDLRFVVEFVPTPGLAKGVTAGTGVRLAQFEADVGGAYLWGSDDVQVNDPASQVVPGEYSHDVIVLSLSATYRL